MENCMLQIKNSLKIHIATIESCSVAIVAYLLVNWSYANSIEGIKDI